MKRITMCLIFATSVASAGIAHAEGDVKETSIAVGYNQTSGNSETSLITAQFKSEKKTEENECLLDVKYAYGQAESETTGDDETTTDKLTAALQKNRLFNEGRCYGFLRADFLKDELADVDYRVSAGPGLGHYFVKTDDHYFRVELGLVYVAEEVASVEDDYLAFLGGEKSEHKLGEKSKVWQSLSVTPEVSDTDNYLLVAEVGTEAAMNSKLSLRVVAVDTYDNTPAPGKDENDLSINAMLVYKL